MRGKRITAARLILALGGGALARRLNRDMVFVVNYHRLRQAGTPESPFDRDVFGPDQEQFDRQMAWLAAHTGVLDEAGLIELLARPRVSGGPYSLVTFDDGYADNHALAYPVLKARGIPGLFFIPSGIIDSRRLGWWDVIAYLIQASPRSEISLLGRAISLEGDRLEAIRQVQYVMKSRPEEATRPLLNELARACGVEPPPAEAQDRELMTWEQIRQMAEDGMAIGSHTQSHRVLASLGEDEQRRELAGSKAVLEERLGRPVRSVAYPVGGPGQISAATLSLARQAGYELGFAFQLGMIKPAAWDRYAIPRLEAPAEPELFEATISLPWIMDYSRRYAGQAMAAS